MGNPKRRKCSTYLERIKKRTNVFKMSKRFDLYKSLDNASRGVFRNHSEIYDGAFLRNNV